MHVLSRLMHSISTGLLGGIFVHVSVHDNVLLHFMPCYISCGCGTVYQQMVHSTIKNSFLTYLVHWLILNLAYLWEYDLQYVCACVFQCAHVRICTLHACVCVCACVRACARVCSG